MTLDRILAITSLSLASLVLGIQILGYFKPHLPSRLDARYQRQGEVQRVGIDDVNGLQDALNAKADANHQHEIGGVNGLQDALDSKANA